MAIKFFISTGSAGAPVVPQRHCFAAMESAFFAIDRGMTGCNCYAEICHYETTPRTENLIKPFLSKFIKNEKRNFVPIRNWSARTPRDMEQIEGLIDFILAPKYQKIFCISTESLQVIVDYLQTRKKYRTSVVKEVLPEFSTGSVLFFSTKEKWMNVFLTQSQAVL